MASVRLVDIAAQAGVSEATVSRVLNNKPTVSAATRQAVLTAIDVLGYERPVSLRVQSVGLIGLIVPELTNPIFPAFAQAIETLLAARNYTVVLCTQTPGGVHEDDYTAMLLDRGVSGIIFISGLHADTRADTERYRSLQRGGVPFLFVNGRVDSLDITAISADDVSAGEAATSYLRDLGHRRIGLAIGPPRFMPVRRKIEGYERALAGLHEPLIAYARFGVEGGDAAATELFSQGATGIICGSDLMALGAIRAARRLGLGVPEDVSVIGYDDSLLASLSSPALTTMRQNVRGMSATIVDALLDLINGAPPSGAEYLFTPELIVRESTGPWSEPGGLQ